MSKTITVSDETYENIKGQLGAPVKMADNYAIVRTRSAGVHAGELVKLEGMVAELANNRRLWYWDGAATLSELAMCGVSKPENCKFPAPVDRIVLTEAIEVLDCSDVAQQSIKGVAVWSAK